MAKKETPARKRGIRQRQKGLRTVTYRHVKEIVADVDHGIVTDHCRIGVESQPNLTRRDEPSAVPQNDDSFVISADWIVADFRIGICRAKSPAVDDDTRVVETDAQSSRYGCTRADREGRIPEIGFRLRNHCQHAVADFAAIAEESGVVAAHGGCNSLRGAAEVKESRKRVRVHQSRERIEHAFCVLQHELRAARNHERRVGEGRRRDVGRVATGVDGDVPQRKAVTAVVTGVAARAAKHDAVKRSKRAVHVPVVRRRPLRVRAAARPDARNRRVMGCERQCAVLREGERKGLVGNHRDAAVQGCRVKSGREQPVCAAIFWETVGQIEFERDLPARVRIEGQGEVRGRKLVIRRELQLERRAVGHRQRRIREDRTRWQRQRPLSYLDATGERVLARKRQRGAARLHEASRARQSLGDRDVVVVGNDQPARADRGRGDFIVSR